METADSADEAGSWPLEHEKPTVQPDVEAGVPASHEWSRSLLVPIALIELAWFFAIGYFVYWLLS
jgi:hypothetical protein